MTGFTSAEETGRRYWLVVAAYPAVALVGVVGVVVSYVRHPSLVELTLSGSALLVALAVVSLAVVPAMVLDSRSLKRAGRPRPRWWRYVAVALAVPAGLYLIAQFAVGPLIAALAAGAVLVVTTFVAAVLYLYERYRALGVGRGNAPAVA